MKAVKPAVLPAIAKAPVLTEEVALTLGSFAYRRTEGPGVRAEERPRALRLLPGGEGSGWSWRSSSSSVCCSVDGLSS